MALITVALGSVCAVAGAARMGSVYRDPAGDSKGAADVVSVGVTNNAHGLITFTVKFSNRVQLTTENNFVIYVDSDQKASTGSKGGGVERRGADYLVALIGKYRKSGFQSPRQRRMD